MHSDGKNMTTTAYPKNRLSRVFGFGDWAPRRLGAQEPLRVGCPRVCIELMYQSSGYRTRFDIKQALTSINQPTTGKLRSQ
jgi:hypothetical protein